MEKKNDKKFNWKKAAIIGGIFAAGVVVGVAGDKACIKLMVEKGYKTVLKKYRLWVKSAVTDKTFGTTWTPADAKEIGETILQYAEEGLTNG